MIATERLKLIPATERRLRVLIESEKKLAEMLGVDLADGWLIFPESIPYTLNMLLNDPANEGWAMYFVVQRDENKLIGCGGYKGAPDETGMVEFGYSVAPAYENRGFATEAAKGFIAHAFATPQVKIVDAHTLAEWNASTSILLKCGLTKIAEKNDPEDGLIWHWRLTRKEYNSGPPADPAK